jgi:CheY-like chemotaxis protein/DNA-directed RNA polymerase specialized sigma24 family protein
MSDRLAAAADLIPRLRRHARLLSGSQEVGDEYVRICLELVAAEPKRLDDGPLPRCLFRAFHLVWSTVANTIEEAGRGGNGPAAALQQGLVALPSLQRRTLLLQVVEEFTSEDVAWILDLDVPLVRALVAEAREELARTRVVRVMIIEDEPLIAMELDRIVRSLGHEVVAMASRESAALEQAERHQLGLILADVQLLDEDSGIVAAQRILERFDVPVVFVTGFPERLLTGGRLEPAFVVAKPFEEEALKVTLGQALAAYADPTRARAHKTALLAKLREINGVSVGIAN